jgi:hypothetical protein
MKLLDIYYLKMMREMQIESYRRPPLSDYVLFPNFLVLLRIDLLGQIRFI